LGIGDWGLGIGDWGLGIGDWAQSPIPNPQSPLKIFEYLKFQIIIKNKFYFFLNYKKNITFYLYMESYENIPTQKEIESILFNFNDKLDKISPMEYEIKNISQYTCQILKKYRDYIFPDLLESIVNHANSEKKIDYLFLIIDIIIILLTNEDYISCKKDALFKIFFCFKKICFILKDFDQQVKTALTNILKYKIYPKDLIEDIMMQLNLNSFSDDIEDKNQNQKEKNVNNLIDENSNNSQEENKPQIREEMIDLNNEKNYEKYRNKIIELNDEIEKQINRYDNDLEKINEINKILNKLNSFINN